MKREIKFRGLRTDGKGWAYGNLLNEQTIGGVGENLSHYKYVTVIPETVGQYTGLKDKNGKEIYEGDVVIRSGKDNCIVEWRSDKCKYDFKYKVDLMSPQWMGGIDNHYSKNELEVIGNVNENKDLI